MALSFFNSKENSMIRPQLTTFLTVCRLGSFSKAASELFLTPSAVLQQVRALEKDLGTPLFNRSSSGVSLTPAGICLEQRAQTLIQLNEEIRREIAAAASAENRICIATSMMEKIRLLCDLWMLFSENENDCEIQMLSIDRTHGIPAGTDLIESVNSGVDWMRDWAFLEICRVPLAFAVPNDHPLAREKLLSISDLRSEHIVSINTGSCDAIADLLELLRRNYISVDCSEPSQGNPLWESAFRRTILITPYCWNDILINMTVIPFEQEFLLPYGIFYRNQPQPAVQRFLNFIRATYAEGNPQGIVPVLS